MYESGYIHVCKKCGTPTNSAISGLENVFFPVCAKCNIALEELLETLPFPAESCTPDNDNGKICAIVVSAFFR